MKEFQISSDRLGFYIEDQYGEDQTPSWRGQTIATAQRKLDEVKHDYLANYEPPNPPGWEGGFAANH